MGNRIIREQVITTPVKKGHAAIASFLKTLSTNTLICDRIGEGGQQALTAAGIEVHSGNADDAVKKLIEGDKRNIHLDVPISFY